MEKERMPKEQRTRKPQELENKERMEQRSADAPTDRSGLASLHHHIGNRGVQRLLAQRSSQEPSELDDETVGRISRERGGGQPLDASVQSRMGRAMGADLSGVRVHTSRESDSLNRQLGAKAFATGKDVFFRQGAYDPHSSGGQELIAHELTHVVQQGAGAVSGGARMTVNAPGDAHEQQADATAKALAGAGAGAQVQRQEEEELQMQPVEEEEELQMQRQEEEELQMQRQEEEELQMQAEEEEEEEEAMP